LRVLSKSHFPEVEGVEKVARENGVAVIDSPVSGGPKGAEEASLTLMAGADGEVFRDNRDVLEAIGKNITYVGKVGQGQATKLINQMLACANIVAVRKL